MSYLIAINAKDWEIKDKDNWVCEGKFSPRAARAVISHNSQQWSLKEGTEHHTQGIAHLCVPAAGCRFHSFFDTV